MKSFIVPLIKNKTGDTSDKGNYRPVAIVSACSTLFECVLLGLIEVCTSEEEQASTALRDRIVFGVRDNGVRKDSCRSAASTCLDA